MQASMLSALVTSTRKLKDLSFNDLNLQDQSVQSLVEQTLRTLTGISVHRL